ncbi:TonB-dependent siderophore receptor [Ottowia thiooxydans]|uniref:TonB-dependent siderophore receptor n=1 Tax=Ottowia thiooxydans TaxID=219182 RepID=UPI000423B8EA|nr:TonB-dependent siderophore receptor [Ottowia thiooxydans]
MPFSTLRRPAPLALAVALAFASGPLLAQVAAGAPVPFNMGAQPLSQALSNWALQTGVQLIVQPALVAGKNAQAVSGSLTPNQALDRLLAGSGLMATRESNAVVIKVAPPVGDAVTLPGVTVTARAERSATTEGTDSLAAREVSINKGDQALKDIPQSISVLTRKQMDERGITDLKDAANNVTGTVGISGVGQGMVLSARGFQIDAWQYDGIAIPRNHYSLGNWGTEGMVFYDRLEVLRGASGLLQGTGSPGGAVNLVRKRGQSEKTVSVTARAGSWGRYGGQLDAGGPLNENGSLRGRVVLDEARSNSFVDYVNDRTRSLYGALDYDISPDTTLGVGVSHLDSKGRPFILGVPLFAGGKEVGLPRSTFTGSGWNRANVEQTTLFADLNHRFNADWKLKVSALRMTEKNTSTHQRMSGEVAPDGSGPSYDDWITDLNSTKMGLDAYVNGRFEALGFPNDVTFGASYSKYKSNDMFARSFTDGANIFNIDHNRPEPTVDSLLAAGGRQSRAAYDVQQKGIFGTWRVRLTEPLTAIVGARASWYDNIYNDLKSGSSTVESTSGKITPYAGLVYAVTPQWSVYGSYTGVFEAQSARTVAGNVLPAVEGRNYEIGVKGELLDGRVNTSLAVFRYDHKNRAVNDVAAGFACDGWYCSLPSGKVRSQGVDAEVSGEVLRNLQVMVGYTYNTSKFLSDPTNQGEVFSTWTPKHMLRAWLSYRFPGDWSKLTVGAGVTRQSHTLDYNRTFEVPGFTVVGLRVGYQFTPEVSLAMNVNNVFDKRYLLPGFIGYTGGTYGDPRNVMFTLKYTPRL